LCFVFLLNSFFWGFPYHGSLPFWYCLFSSLIPLSIYSVFCFTLVFIQGSYEFICFYVFSYSLFLLSWNFLSSPFTF
jgi:hypothetical protein